MGGVTYHSFQGWVEHSQVDAMFCFPLISFSLFHMYLMPESGGIFPVKGAQGEDLAISEILEEDSI